MKLTNRLHCTSLRYLLLSGFVSIALIYSAFANPVPQNLGNGLDKIVESKLLEAGTINPPAQTQTIQPKEARTTKNAQTTTTTTAASYDAGYKAAVAQKAAMYNKMAITDAASGKYLVEIMPNGLVALEELRAALEANFPATDIRHVDAKYASHGVLEGYITIEDAPNIARTRG